MADEHITLNELRDLLVDLEFPITREAAADACDDVVLDYADGEEPLDTVIGRVPSDEFETARDLEEEIQTSLPREAVGEPGQSEGDA